MLRFQLHLSKREKNNTAEINYITVIVKASNVLSLQKKNFNKMYHL